MSSIESTGPAGTEGSPDLGSIVVNPDGGGEIMEMVAKHNLGYVKMPPVAPFMSALLDLSAVGMGDFSSHLPAFRLRLDVNGKDETERVNNMRLLVRPVEFPIMHDELKLITEIAEKYELAVSSSNAGLVLHRPEALPA